MERFDIVIIGAGPAGVSAAITGKIRRKNILLIGKEEVSSKLGKAKHVGNYPGFPDITGSELSERYLEHLKRLEIAITPANVKGIYDMGGYFRLECTEAEYEATAVIIATGSDQMKVMQNEKKFLGNGVSYCATCDGNFFRGRTVAVICESKEHEDDVEFLCSVAGCVHYFPVFESSLEAENLVKHKGMPPVAVNGTEYVTGVSFRNGEEIAVDGVFIIKNAAADTILAGLETKDGYIVVDHEMNTNIPGCFAAGDCTGEPRQIAKAAGEGNTAVISAIQYVSTAGRK